MSVLHRTEVRDKALIIWNCNPTMRNALSPDYYHGLLEGLDLAKATSSVAAVILAGEGNFSVLVET